MSLKISELPSLILANLVATANTAVPVVSDVNGGLTTYQTTIANVKSYVETGDLTVTGDITSANTVINGTLTVIGGIIGNITTGTQTTVTSAGSLVNIQTDGNLSYPLNNGLDVGTRMFYNKGTGDAAALIWKNSNSILTYYGAGVGNAATTINAAASYGTMQLGALILSNTTATTGARTGVLQINGGAYISGNIWSYESITNLGNSYTLGNVVAGNLQANGATTMGSTLVVAGTTTVNGLTVNTSGSFGTTLVTAGNATVNALTVNNSSTMTTLGVSGAATLANIIAGNISSGNIIVTTLYTGNIYPTTSNVSNIGSSVKQFNTIFATATSAQYADLAEKYEADAEYEPGTVVVFGGNKEITVTTNFADNRVAGIISTDPAYLMNSHSTGLPVALRGKVPVKVVGAVSKGDLLVSSTVAGYAESLNFNKPEPYTVVAKSLEDSKATEPRTIIAVVL